MAGITAAALAVVGRTVGSGGTVVAAGAASESLEAPREILVSPLLRQVSRGTAGLLEKGGLQRSTE